MGTTDDRCYEILSTNLNDASILEFVVAETRGQAWTEGKVSGMNSALERDNPGDYARGMRYSYRQASGAPASAPRRSTPGGPLP
jgi:hypothetical protein